MPLSDTSNCVPAGRAACVNNKLPARDASGVSAQKLLHAAVELHVEGIFLHVGAVLYVPHPRNHLRVPSQLAVDVFDVRFDCVDDEEQALGDRRHRQQLAQVQVCHIDFS